MKLEKELGVKISSLGSPPNITVPPPFGNGVVPTISRHRCGCEASHGPSPEDISGSGVVPNMISEFHVAVIWYDADAVGEEDV